MTGPEDPDRGVEGRLECDLLALDPRQRARRVRLMELVRASTMQVVELPDGYALRLGPDGEATWHAEELVRLEEKCCPFLALSLGRDETTGALVLEITGSGEAKQFIGVELGVVAVRDGRAV